MCMICVEFKLGKLTRQEAYTNLLELGPHLEESHLLEVYNLISDLEINKETDSKDR